MFKQPPCVEALAKQTDLTSRHLGKHLRYLQQLGWVDLIRDGKRLRPVAIVPWDVETMIAAKIRMRVRLSPYKGEEVTAFFVEWIVAPRVRLIRHARPDFLRNQETGQNLEYDIYVPEFYWAIEYHGEQHFGPTQRYQGDRAFVERHKRDLRKAQLSKNNNIRLSVVHNRILTLNGILEVIPNDIPRRVFDPKGPVILTLEELGREVARNQDWDRE
jgi:DNA-binding transcriptional ArsR family regulator